MTPPPGSGRVTVAPCHLRSHDGAQHHASGGRLPAAVLPAALGAQGSKHRRPGMAGVRVGRMGMDGGWGWDDHRYVHDVFMMFGM